jgi:hypothetical protein
MGSMAYAVQNGPKTDYFTPSGRIFLAPGKCVRRSPSVIIKKSACGRCHGVVDIFDSQAWTAAHLDERRIWTTGPARRTKFQTQLRLWGVIR